MNKFSRGLLTAVQEEEEEEEEVFAAKSSSSEDRWPSQKRAWTSGSV